MQGNVIFVEVVQSVEDGKKGEHHILRVEHNTDLLKWGNMLDFDGNTSIRFKNESYACLSKDLIIKDAENNLIFFLHRTTEYNWDDAPSTRQVMQLQDEIIDEAMGRDK